MVDAAISQGNFGQPDGSAIIGWRVSAETLTAMGSAGMCLPMEIADDLERLRAIASWWETSAAERKTKLQAALEQVDDRDTRRYLWDSILPLVYAIAAPSQTASERKPTGTVADITDANLLSRAVRNLARLNTKRRPLWAAVMDTFGLGSTYAQQLCERFGLDPDTGKEIGS